MAVVKLEGNNLELERGYGCKKSKLGFKKGMAVAFLNVNHLTTHTDERRKFVMAKGIHILAINEL